MLPDVKLPDMDGFEACRRIRKDLHTRDIPVKEHQGSNEVHGEGPGKGSVFVVTLPLETRSGAMA